MKAVSFLLVTAAFSHPAAARAETDFRNLNEAERAVLGAEIRAVLREAPEIAEAARGAAAPQPADIYAEEAKQDQELIAKLSDRLFDPDLSGFGPGDGKLRLSLITAPGCETCRLAEEELRYLSEAYGVYVTLIDVNTAPDLAGALGVDTIPFYVFPKMMLRGHMPAPVLARYFEQGTGQ